MGCAIANRVGGIGLAEGTVQEARKEGKGQETSVQAEKGSKTLPQVTQLINCQVGI